MKRYIRSATYAPWNDPEVEYVCNTNGFQCYRKIVNGRGKWFAHRQDDPIETMFPITYDQARGFEPMPNEPAIRKLQRELGKMLLPVNSSTDVNSDYYLVTAYYDNKYRGRADEFSSDNFEEIVDKAHEYCSDGYYVEVENMGSGEGKRFDPEKWMECIERYGEVPSSIYNLSE